MRTIRPNHGCSMQEVGHITGWILDGSGGWALACFTPEVDDMTEWMGPAALWGTVLWGRNVGFLGSGLGQTSRQR